MATKKPNAPTTTSAPATASKAKRLAVGDVPEVEEFMDMKRTLDTFKADHEHVFIQFSDLVDRYNTALEAAETKIRSMGVTCGPFENFSVSTKINPDKMFEELGEKLFHAVGGKSGTKTIYTADNANVLANIASGKIPAECVPNFVTEVPSYHVPKKITAA